MRRYVGIFILAVAILGGVVWLARAVHDADARSLRAEAQVKSLRRQVIEQTLLVQQLREAGVAGMRVVNASGDSALIDSLKRIGWPMDQVRRLRMSGYWKYPQPAATASLQAYTYLDMSRTYQ